MSTSYVLRSHRTRLPRIPLEGAIDLTYRCNNICHHCWLWLNPHSGERENELSFDEITRIADQARALGTRGWTISGGEPMLRDDFYEIFDYLTRISAGYSLNTNGTLITPRIARLMKRKGVKMIAVYGATAEVYDRVTRHPGGFEALMRGITYLKEAGAKFVVQLIPMHDNWHQWQEMVSLARSLSSEYRVGAAWLHYAADGSEHKNRQIQDQRLPPSTVIDLDFPTVEHPWNDPGAQDRILTDKGSGTDELENYQSEHLLASCADNRNEFHIDPYGGMTFCAMVKDPKMRFSLREHTFAEVWDELIPASGSFVHANQEYLEGCGSCEQRADCRWCAAYSYLETGRYTASIPYLCEIAHAAKEYKSDWQENHRRYFQVAGITVCLESDLDLTPIKFKDELLQFQVDHPGEDMVILSHHFELPPADGVDFGSIIYNRPPWRISRKDEKWYYRGIMDGGDDESTYHRLAIFNKNHTRANISHPNSYAEVVKEKGWSSLSLFSTDQIWIIPLLADRNAVLVHSSAAIINGQGVVFVGHSDAGKSTTVTMLQEASRSGALPYPVEILCDDRNIIRRWESGWLVHGTWSHGDVSTVSASSAPLRAVFFLVQDDHNQLTLINERREVWSQMLSTLIKSVDTKEWWQKELDILGYFTKEIPCYWMHFDKSGGIIAELAALLA